MFSDDVMAQAEAEHNEMLEATKARLEMKKKQAADAFGNGRRLRFRAHGHEALATSMDAISQHVKSFARSMGAAHHSVDSMVRCENGAMCLPDSLSFASPADFKKRIETATST